MLPFDLCAAEQLNTMMWLTGARNTKILKVHLTENYYNNTYNWFGKYHKQLTLCFDLESTGEHRWAQFLALPVNLPQTFMFLLCHKTTKSPWRSRPTLTWEKWVFWVGAKHSIWQVIKEVHLPKCSEAGGPVGQGSVDWEEETVDEPSVSQSFVRALPVAATIPARVAQPSRVRRQGMFLFW